MDAFGKILVASSDLEMRRSIIAILRRLGADPVCASTVSQSREVLAERSVGLAFCDRHFVDGTYRDLLDFVNSYLRARKTRVVLATNFVEPGEYAEAKRWGVFDVIASPSHCVAVEWMVILAHRDELKRRDQSRLKQAIPRFPAMAAAAAKM
jgi:DNA-binding NtrC family response regulator